MKVFVTGGTGFVGSRLIPALIDKGHEVVLLVRPSETERDVPGGDRVQVVVGESTEAGTWWEAVKDCGAAVNLAGYPVFSRWTPKVKMLLRKSRLATTRNLVQAIPKGGPFVLVSASGIGIFGDAADRVLEESSSLGRRQGVGRRHGYQRQTEGQLFLALQGDYWVLDLGTEYEYSVVGTPSREYLWILSRTPKLDPALYERILGTVESLGFDPKRLRKTQQM